MGLGVRLPLRQMWKARPHVTLCCNINLSLYLSQDQSVLKQVRINTNLVLLVLAEEVPVPSKSVQKNLENANGLDPSATCQERKRTVVRCMLMHARVCVCETSVQM